MLNLNEQETPFNKSIFLICLSAKLDLEGTNKTQFETLGMDDLKTYIRGRLTDDTDSCVYVIRAKYLMSKEAEMFSDNDVVVCNVNRKTYCFSDPEVICSDTISEQVEHWFRLYPRGICITN